MWVFRLSTTVNSKYQVRQVLFFVRLSHTSSDNAKLPTFPICALIVYFRIWPEVSISYEVRSFRKKILRKLGTDTAGPSCPYKYVYDSYSFVSVCAVFMLIFSWIYCLLTVCFHRCPIDFRLNQTTAELDLIWLVHNHLSTVKMFIWNPFRQLLLCFVVFF